jgi:hypothetical protein
MNDRFQGHSRFLYTHLLLTEQRNLESYDRLGMQLG